MASEEMIDVAKEIFKKNKQKREDADKRYGLKRAKSSHLYY